MSYQWGMHVTVDVAFTTPEPDFVFAASEVKFYVRDPNNARTTYTGPQLDPSGVNSFEVTLNCRRSGWWFYSAEAESTDHHVVTPANSFYVSGNKAVEA